MSDERGPVLSTRPAMGSVLRLVFVAIAISLAISALVAWQNPKVFLSLLRDGSGAPGKWRFVLFSLLFTEGYLTHGALLFDFVLLLLLLTRQETTAPRGLSIRTYDREDCFLKRCCLVSVTWGVSLQTTIVVLLFTVDIFGSLGRLGWCPGRVLSVWSGVVNVITIAMFLPLVESILSIFHSGLLHPSASTFCFWGLILAVRVSVLVAYPILTTYLIARTRSAVHWLLPFILSSLLVPPFASGLLSAKHLIPGSSAFGLWCPVIAWFFISSCVAYGGMRWISAGETGTKRPGIQ